MEILDSCNVPSVNRTKNKQMVISLWHHYNVSKRIKQMGKTMTFEHSRLLADKKEHFLTLEIAYTDKILIGVRIPTKL